MAKKRTTTPKVVSERAPLAVRGGKRSPLVPPLLQEEQRGTERPTLLHNDRRTPADMDPPNEKMTESDYDGIVVIDAKGTILSLGSSVRNVLGYSTPEITGKKVVAFVHPDDHERFLRDLRKLARTTRNNVTFEARFLHQSGAWRRMEGVGANLLRLPSVQALVVKFRDISMRKRGAESAGQSVMHFRSMMSDAPVILFATDRDGIFTMSEGHGLGSLGIEPGEHVGRSVFDVYRDLPELVEKFRKALQGEPVHTIIRVGDKVFESRMRPMRNSQGEPDGIVGVSIDITERANIEEQLRAGELKYRTLVNSMSEGLLMVDNDDVILFVNDRYCDLMGFTREELIGKRAMDLVLREEDRSIMKTRNALRTKGISEEYEIQLRRKSGELLWVRIGAAPIVDARGNVSGSIGVHTDVSERRKVQEILQESERRFRQFADHIEGVVWMADHRKPEILFVSTAYERIWGRSCKSLYDNPRSFLDAIHADDRDRVERSLGRQVERSGADVEFRVVHPDASLRWVRLRGFPIRDRVGRVYRIAGIAEDITERRSVENALRTSEAKLRLITSQLPAVLWTTDHTLRLTSLLGASLGQFHLNPGRDIGKTLYELFETRDKDFAPIAAHLRALRGESVRYENRFNDRDYDVQVQPLRNERGEIIGCMRLAVDITDRKVAESAVRASEERYRSLVENISEIYFVVDNQGRIVYCSPNMFQMTGYTTDEIIGKLYLRLIAPEERSRIVKFFREHTEDGTIDARIEFLGRRKDGVTGWIEQSTRIIRDDRGEVVEYRNVVRDIRERKRVEDQLRLLAHAVESTSELICITDLDDRFTFVNKAFLEAYGYEEQEIVGQTPAIIVSPNNPPEISHSILDSSRRGGWQGELINRRKDGSEFPILLSTSVIKNAEGTAIALMGVARDITGQKRVVEEIRGMATALEQRVLERTTELVLQKDELARVNERLERLIDELKEAKSKAEDASKAKSQFLANVSHELRTPLNSVIGFANVLLKNRDRRLNHVEVDYLEKILGNGKHLLNVINQMLDLSKIETGRTDLDLSTIFLGALVQETIAELAGQVPAGVVMKAEIPNQIAPLRTDYGKLKQVLINLLGNAIKFTRKGRITVKVRTDSLTAQPTHIDVIDTGIGIPKEQLGTIFEAFQQVDNTSARQYEGTGLGLTISKSMCELMGYRLAVESGEGKGSTFTICLQ